MRICNKTLTVSLITVSAFMLSMNVNASGFALIDHSASGMGNDRRWLAFGFSYETANNMTVDVGYAHLFISDARINNTLESSTPHLNSTLTGTYEDHSDTISAQVTWGF